jgi:riboflavin-specific deaminase-like protein
MTLDGRIATARGESQWITDEAARTRAHQLRGDVDAILVGIGTVLRDDPQLTARIAGDPPRLAAQQPLRVVVDSRLRIPLKAAVLQQQQDAHTVIATTSAASPKKIDLLRGRGIDVLVLPKCRSVACRIVPAPDVFCRSVAARRAGCERSTWRPIAASLVRRRAAHESAHRAGGA